MSSSLHQFFYQVISQIWDRTEAFHWDNKKLRLNESIYFTNIVTIRLYLMLINVLIILGFSDELISAVLQCRRIVG